MCWWKDGHDHLTGSKVELQYCMSDIQTNQPSVLEYFLLSKKVTTLDIKLGWVNRPYFKFGTPCSAFSSNSTFLEVTICCRIFRTVKNVHPNEFLCPLNLCTLFKF